MPLVATLDSDISQIDATKNEFVIDGPIAYSGSYPTNGDTLDLSQLGIPSLGLPIWVEVYEATAAVNKPGWGGAFLYFVGTTLANGIVELFNGTTQITTATYASIFPAGPVVMRFRAYFKSF